MTQFLLWGLQEVMEYRGEIIFTDGKQMGVMLWKALRDKSFLIRLQRSSHVGCRPLDCRTTLDPAMPQALIFKDTIQVFSALLLVEILCNVLGMGH